MKDSTLSTTQATQFFVPKRVQFSLQNSRQNSLTTLEKKSNAPSTQNKMRSQHRRQFSQDTDLQEKLKIKTYWRHLLRWQGFDDYLYLRDAVQIRELRGVDQIQNSDLIEPLSFTQTANFAKIQSLFQTSKQKPKIVQIRNLSFIQVSSPTAPKRKSQLFTNHQIKEQIREIIEMLSLVSRKIQTQEIEEISPKSEKIVKLLWQTGIFNFYSLGIYTHCLILEIYGKESLAMYNWKKYLKVCSTQGHSSHKYKLVAYKHLSNINIRLQAYDKALSYLKKMLKLAWTVDNKDFELLAYDKISIVCYYQQDIEKTLYFHEKFSTGQWEQKGTQVRSVGENQYVYAAKLQEGGMDSNSDDEFDLNLLIQQSFRKKPEVIPKKKIVSEQGPTFSKLDRMETKPHQFSLQRMLTKMNDYKKKETTLLGPIYSKNSITLNKSCSMHYYFSQKSTNRVAQNYLVQNVSLGYKPVENVVQVKKIIKILQYDLTFYAQHKSLYQNGLEDLI